jgi:hypothetical protein
VPTDELRGRQVEARGSDGVVELPDLLVVELFMGGDEHEHLPVTGRTRKSCCAATSTVLVPMEP